MAEILSFVLGMGLGLLISIGLMYIFEQCIRPCCIREPDEGEYSKIEEEEEFKVFTGAQGLEEEEEEDECCTCSCMYKLCCTLHFCRRFGKWLKNIFDIDCCYYCRRGPSDQRSCYKVCCCEEEDEEDPDAIELGSMADIPFAKLDSDFVNSGVIEDISIVVGVDLTRSNKFKGRRTFGRKMLHTINKSLDDATARQLRSTSGDLNLYERCMLAAEHFLRTDTEFPLYYFGSDEAAEVGGFLHVKDCDNTLDLWKTYRETVKTQKLGGPGRFCPLLQRTIERVKFLNRYHILLILTDGDMEDEEEFGEALRKAAESVPLSVVIVGIGDGPFHVVEKFDDDIGDKRFDNMQFVAFSEVTQKTSIESQKEDFFTKAFNEIPRQYRACRKILNYRAPMRRVKKFEENISMNWQGTGPETTDGLAAASYKPGYEQERWRGRSVEERKYGRDDHVTYGNSPGSGWGEVGGFSRDKRVDRNDEYARGKDLKMAKRSGKVDDVEEAPDVSQYTHAGNPNRRADMRSADPLYNWKGSMDQHMQEVRLRFQRSVSKYGHDYYRLFFIYADDDNRLSKSSFMQCVRKECAVSVGAMEDKELEEIFDFIDRDRSQNISLNEFKAFCLDGVPEPVVQSSAGKKLKISSEELEGMKARFRAAAIVGSKGSDFDELFKRMDRSGDKRIDIEEFRRSVRKIGKLTSRVFPDEQLNILFDRLDTDHSGTIDIDEFVAFIRSKGVPKRKSKSADQSQLFKHIEFFRDRLARLIDHNPRIFVELDHDDTGDFTFANILDLARHDLRISPNEMSDEDVSHMFEMIDDDNNKRVTIDELEDFMNGVYVLSSGKKVKRKVRKSLDLNSLRGRFKQAAERPTRQMGGDFVKYFTKYARNGLVSYRDFCRCIRKDIRFNNDAFSNTELSSIFYAMAGGDADADAVHLSKIWDYMQ